MYCFKKINRSPTGTMYGSKYHVMVMKTTKEITDLELFSKLFSEAKASTPDRVFPFEARLDELDKFNNADHCALDPHHIVHKDCPVQRERLKS